MAGSESRRISFHRRATSSLDKRDDGQKRPDSTRRDSILLGDSKANPNAAMLEAQPGTLNLAESSTLPSLRTSPQKDSDGNVIDEPDLSNPTRARYERPLETIARFERLANGNDQMSTNSFYTEGQEFTSRRNSMMNNNSRFSRSRNSSFINPSGGGFDNSMMGNTRPPGSRMYSYQSPGTPGRMTPDGSFRRQSYGPRSNSENYGQSRMRAMYQQQQPQQGQYPMSSPSDNNNQATSSDSSGQGPYSTDPTSSEESSLDRMYAANNKSRTPEPYSNYAYDSGNDGIIAEEHDYMQQNQSGPVRPPPSSSMNNRRLQAALPAPPTASPVSSTPRTPIQLGGSSSTYESQGGQLPSFAPPAPPPKSKRTSWFKRRSSKNI